MFEGTKSCGEMLVFLFWRKGDRRGQNVGQDWDGNWNGRQFVNNDWEDEEEKVAISEQLIVKLWVLEIFFNCSLGVSSIEYAPSTLVGRQAAEELE